MCESLMNFYNQAVNKETLQKTQQIFKHFYPHEDSNVF